MEKNTLKDLKDLHKDLVSKMKELQAVDSLFQDFCNWKTEFKPKNVMGMSHNSMYKDAQHINDVMIRDLEGGNTYDRYSNIESDNRILKARTFLKYIDEYFEYKNRKSQEVNKGQLSNRYWYMYFLNIGDSKKEYPRIGRALLITENDNRAILKVPDSNPNIEDYKGEFQRLNNEVYFFDLDSYDRYDQKTLKKKLHIKLFLGKASDAIMIGSYSTYDKRIFNGALVLEQITKTKKVTDEMKPLFLSAVDNDEIFKSLDTGIKDYLAIKTKNYYKVPKEIISTKKALHDFITRDKREEPDRKDIENRFLEREKPMIFISSPQTSISGDEGKTQKMRDMIKQIIERLKTDFKDNYSIYHEHSDASHPLERTQPLETLNHLERSRYFILILPKTEKMSFSLIQLGWALQVCKHILFIYEGNIVSERLKYLEDVNPWFRTKNRRDEEFELNKIYDDISYFIHRKRFDKREK